MANLTPDEFNQAVACLAADLGLQRLRDKLVRLNGLVTRRRAVSPEALANELYMLTGGLRRQVPASFAVQGVWGERMSALVGEDGEKALEGLAEKINACLGDGDGIAEGKEAELDELLRQYESELAAKVGPERARIDMLLKAVPAVATKLRAMPPATPSAAPEPVSAPAE